VGRWGGDEFLIVLLETDPDKAFVVAEKIRTIINSAAFSVPEHLSCSFGAASYRQGDSKDQLLARADKALYEAKNSGRNKIVFKALN
jgi:polar amino acid transport system substrate-binding protein